jgi:DNA-binding NtrC family response regulator
MLRQTCWNLVQVANGGSLLFTCIEDMPGGVQEQLIELLGDLQRSMPASRSARLMAGTTVSLYDRIADGTFSTRLFYRLNVIHLVLDDAVPVADRRRHARWRDHQ